METLIKRENRKKKGNSQSEEILAILEKEGPTIEDTEGVTEREERLYKKLEKYSIIFGPLPPEWEGIYQKLKEKINMQNKKEETEGNSKVEREDNGEIPQEIKDFRKTWEEKIENLDKETKNKIIEATNKIAPKIQIEPDGSRRIEIKIGGKTYKILDVNTETHTDSGYGKSRRYARVIKHRVKLGGMIGDNVDDWNNEELKEYVKEKQGEGFHVPKIEEMRSLLNELGKGSGITEERNQTAMLMYLTGMYGRYWLSMGDDKKSDSQANSRSGLQYYGSYRGPDSAKDKDFSASLCLIASS